MDNHSIIDGDKMSDDLHNELRKIYDESDKQEQKDHEDFFNIIRDEHQKWWS